MTFQEIVREIPHLSLEERQALLNIINNTLDEPHSPKHSILEFQGIGRGLLSGIDAQDYVNSLRDEWDERERNIHK